MDFRFRLAAVIAVPILAALSTSPAAQPFPTIPIHRVSSIPHRPSRPKHLSSMPSMQRSTHSCAMRSTRSARGVATSRATAHLPLALRATIRCSSKSDSSNGTSDAIATLQRHGATHRHSIGDVLHEAWIPLSRLRELAAEPNVVVIRPARLARPLIGSKTSEGVAAGNATIWQPSRRRTTAPASRSQ